MQEEIHRLRRAGGGVLRLLVDLIPVDLPPESGAEGAVEEICLVFADVADYSDFVAETGDAAAMRVLGVLDGVVQQALQGHEGARVVKRLGDGVMIVTASSSSALRIAMDLVDGFTEGTDVIGTPLALRAGVHRGTCRRHDGDYFGYHVNLAARVAAAADPDETITTAHALAGVDLEALGLIAAPAGVLEAKGVSSPLPVFVLSRTEADEGPARPRRPGIPLLWPLNHVPGLGERRFRAG